MSNRIFVHNRNPDRRFFAFDMFGTLVTNKKHTVLPIFEALCRYYPEQEPECISRVYRELLADFKKSHTHTELPFDAIVNHLDLSFGCRNDPASMEEPLLIETGLFEAAEGAGAVLEYLRKHGYKIGVLSNTRYHSGTLRKLLLGCGLAEYVDAVVASADIAYRKPDIRSYRAILGRLGAEAKDCYYCGDNLSNDYYGPLSAGMKGAVFIGAEHAGVSLKRIDRLCDLPSVFETTD